MASDIRQSMSRLSRGVHFHDVVRQNWTPPILVLIALHDVKSNFGLPDLVGHGVRDERGAIVDSAAAAADAAFVGRDLAQFFFGQVKQIVEKAKSDSNLDGDDSYVHRRGVAVRVQFACVEKNGVQKR